MQFKALIFFRELSSLRTLLGMRGWGELTAPPPLGPQQHLGTLTCACSLCSLFQLGPDSPNCNVLVNALFWNRKEIHFINRFKVYLKYTLNSWWTLSIIRTYKTFSRLFSNYFHEVANFGSQTISEIILEVYFILKVHKYIWSMVQFQQDKILVEVHIICGAMA